MTRRTHAARLVLTLLLLVAVDATVHARHAPAPVASTQDKVAPQVEVLWNGIWWDATVVSERDHQMKIHYIGWGAGWDEWVDGRRFRPANLARLKGAEKGQRVEINWRGGWWPGRVISVGRGQYKITYDNYGPGWDEWVPAARLRAFFRPVA